MEVAETAEVREQTRPFDSVGDLVSAADTEITRPGFWSEWPPALSVDCSPEYVRMCVAAVELQEWWRQPPVSVRYEEGGRQYHVNVRVGDYVHHGPHAVLHRGGRWPQISMVANIGTTLIYPKAKEIRAGEWETGAPTTHVTFRIEHDKGGFLYDQYDEQFLDGYFVWLPKLDQLIEGSRLRGQAWAYKLSRMWELPDNFFRVRDDATQEKVALNLMMAQAYGKLWDGEGWREMQRGTVI
jgi:hypothetical protein